MHTNKKDFGNEILFAVKQFGQEALRGKEGILEFFPTMVKENQKVTKVSLYILAREMKFEYQPISIRIVDDFKLTLFYFTMATRQVQHFDLDISFSIEPLVACLNQIMNFAPFKATIDLLVDQTLIKRDYRKSTPVLDKIIIGQAKVAELSDGRRINVGFIRVDDNEVYYYNDLALRQMFRPNMNDEERSHARILQSKTEDELMQAGYIEKRQVSDFKDIF